MHLVSTAMAGCQSNLLYLSSFMDHLFSFLWNGRPALPLSYLCSDLVYLKTAHSQTCSHWDLLFYFLLDLSEQTTKWNILPLNTHPHYWAACGWTNFWWIHILDVSHLLIWPFLPLKKLANQYCWYAIFSMQYPYPGKTPFCNYRSCFAF